MTEPTARGTAGASLPGIPAESRGVAAEGMRLFGSITRHLQSMSALAGLEGREALGLYLRMAVVGGAVLFFLAFGYVFILLFAAFAIAHFLQVDWVWISLGLAILHLLAALAGALYVKKKSATPVFRGTMEEIRRDVAALRGSNSTPLM